MNKTANTTLLVILTFIGVVILFHSWGMDWETSLAFSVAASVLITPFFLPPGSPDDDIDYYF